MKLIANLNEDGNPEEYEGVRVYGCEVGESYPDGGFARMVCAGPELGLVSVYQITLGRPENPDRPQDDLLARARTSRDLGDRVGWESIDPHPFVVTRADFDLIFGLIERDVWLRQGWRDE